MTPEEKAKELVNKYCDISSIDLDDAKYCALIAFEEIMKALQVPPIENKGSKLYDSQIDYWQQVKQEIQKAMKVYIEAIAPTIYQLGSLQNFGIPNRQVSNGSYISLKETDSVDDAERYLIKRAILYNDKDPEGSDDKLLSMINDVRKHGLLRLDSVTAHINVKSL